MRILIVGPNSYIARSFSSASSVHHPDWVLDGLSVRDDRWKTWDYSVYDSVLYCAAVVHRKETPQLTSLARSLNCDIPVAMAELFRAQSRSASPQFIYLSTMAVFGQEGRLGTTVTIDGSTAPAPKTLYGTTKLAAEQVLQAMVVAPGSTGSAAAKPLSLAIFRPPMVYGPDCPGNYQRLKKFVLKFRLFPTLTNRRSMIHIDTLAAQLMDCVASCRAGIFHPQEPDYVCTVDLARNIAAEAGVSVRFCSLLNPLVRLGALVHPAFSKVWGNLVYSKDMDASSTVEQAQPLVSIIMPCYNMESFLRRTIASVQAQTYPCWELLVTDDGSTDDSRRILTDLAKEDPRIKPLYLPHNGGIAAARNAGLERASGRYRAFLDSDDLWMPEKLAVQLRFMREHNAAFTYTAYERVTEDLTLLNTKQVPAQLSYRDLLKKNEIGCLSVMIDRDKVGDFSMPHRKHEDYATWLSILRTTGLTAYGIQDPLARYVVRDGSVSRNKWRSMTWVYGIYTQQEGLSPLTATLYLMRWFFRSLLT